MVVINSYGWAVFLIFITMLCWGSWANTQKLTQKQWQSFVADRWFKKRHSEGLAAHIDILKEYGENYYKYKRNYEK